MPSVYYLKRVSTSYLIRIIYKQQKRAAHPPGLTALSDFKSHQEKIIPLYEIAIEADRSEKVREAAEAWYAHHDMLWTSTQASNRGEVQLSEAEATGCWTFMTGLLDAAD